MLTGGVHYRMDVSHIMSSGYYSPREKTLAIADLNQSDMRCRDIRRDVRKHRTRRRA